MEIRSLRASATYPLRGAVLRPGQPLTTARYDGDEAAGTTHFGAFTAGRLVAVASLFIEAAPGGISSHCDLPEAMWRLRGMAVAPEAQRRGFGRAVLEACIAHIARQGGGLLWCNARASAVGFYRAAGFEISGAEFTIPGIGPHFVMWRIVT